MSKHFNFDKFITKIAQRDPDQKEFLQAIKEVLAEVTPFLYQNKQYQQMSILEMLAEPERIIQFRVPWIDDKGNVHVNRGFRIQYSSALGPYKGGLRFHPSVNLSVLKFLGFEQTFKNALTSLPLGGGKGGADFDPKGKSDYEIMRFCQSFMTELFRYIGPQTDIPAGDIGVGVKEIGYMFGQYKKIRNSFSGSITGKSEIWGGSALRPEATGYGLVYFLQKVLDHHKEELKGKKIAISGSGNVAQFAARKLLHLEAVVITFSDSDGCLYFPKGVTEKELDKIISLKNEKRGRLSELKTTLTETTIYYPSKKPWEIDKTYEIGLPCATQNEIEPADAKKMVLNGIRFLVEGANMPTTPEALDFLIKKKVIFVPGKAANAGGVAVSAFEMSQNALHSYWEEQEIDKKLIGVMNNIHQQCVRYGTEKDNTVNYIKGANIAGFIRIADAMIEQGIV